MNIHEYDFQTKINQANTDMERLFEIQDAKFNINIIEARYAELQKDLERAIERADKYERRVNENAHASHIYNTMMDAVKDNAAAKEAFEDFLAVLKLADSDIEVKMQYKAPL